MFMVRINSKRDPSPFVSTCCSLPFSVTSSLKRRQMRETQWFRDSVALYTFSTSASIGFGKGTSSIDRTRYVQYVDGQLEKPSFLKKPSSPA